MSIFAAALLTLASGGSASGDAEPAKAKPQDNKTQSDPIVCQAYDELGSRLKHRKTCKRRSEWRVQQEEDRQAINRAQVQRGLDPAG